ncbi:MAG: acylphosphatase, partial [Planctomycetaceae bacterium]
MSSPSSPQICVRVEYRGRVQGVGFRWTVARIARNIAVTGTVRNCTDGSVELIAQGDRPVVMTLLSNITTAMQGYIEHSDVEELTDRK